MILTVKPVNVLGMISYDLISLIITVKSNNPIASRRDSMPAYSGRIINTVVNANVYSPTSRRHPVVNDVGVTVIKMLEYQATLSGELSRFACLTILFIQKS